MQFNVIPRTNQTRAYQIKGNQVCSNMVANILPMASPPFPQLWVKMSNSTFSEHGHVAYQVKGNLESSNMVANVLPANTYPSMPPPPPQHGDGVKIQLFQTL